MRVRGPAIALLAVCPWVVAAAPATGPTTGPATAPAAVGQPPFEAGGMTMTAAAARVWQQGSLSVAELTGPVTIALGTATLTADAAVVWLRPAAGADGKRAVDVVLLGHAEVHQADVTFSYDRYWIPASVTGAIRLVGPRTTGADVGSATYRAAVDLVRQQRPSAAMPAAVATRPATTTASTTATTLATAAPTVSLPPPLPGAGTPLPARVVGFNYGDISRERTADGELAYVCTGGVGLRYLDAKGDLLEFLADHMVLFTDLKGGHELAAGGGQEGLAAHIVAGYFEGDARVFTTPQSASRAELRMRAGRVYYEFATDRAVLTNVVFHTTDAKKGIPIFMRAQTVRQLSQGEFKADGVKLSTSAFATPTYGLSAEHAYVREEDSGDPRVGSRVAYAMQDVTLDAFGVPIFYVPAAGGTMTARGSIFRGFGLEDSNQFGFGLRTDWGLFETLGEPPPEHVDADYHLDYFSDRGPAGGINGSYYGGTVSDVDKQPYNFAGDLHSYFVDDHGTDVLGADRYNEKAPEQFRGRATFEHQQYFGDDVTAQVRLGYDSDSNFMPQWFPDEYRNGLPVDESLYLKDQHGSELASFLAEWQPNRVVSTADDEQENREVSHLPEVRYERVGDSVLADHLTFFSDNDAAGEKFVRSEQSLKQQGFYTVPVNPPFVVEPGIPAYAYTGDPGSTTYRGDTRQEVDYPVNLGLLHVVPYAFGRYTVYSQGPDPTAKQSRSPLRTLPGTVANGTDQNRLMAGGGVRLTTDFWRVDDSIQSDLFDLHRLRHVVTPEVTLFASGQTVDQNRLYIYDPQQDALNDVQAAQVALRQRWQTKRGGPGKWRSVDFFTLDVYANLFANQPAIRYRDPADFRSVFLQSEPEYSIPRNTGNVDGTWRISDTTAVLAGVVHNLDYQKLATANIGVAVTRDERLSYYLGTRYIADLNSDVASFSATYQLDRKYSLNLAESVDLGQNRNVYYTASITRRFDNFSATVDAHYDQSTNDEGFGFNVSPLGLARGVGSSQVQQVQAAQLPP